MSEPTTQMLFDLALLIRRYPSKDWIKLARMIGQQKSRARIVVFLENLSELSAAVDDSDSRRNPKNNAKTKIDRDAEQVLREAQKVRLELSQMTTPELRKLALKLRLRVSPKDSKKRLVKQILRSSNGKMAALKNENLFDVSTAPSDYGQWAKIILGQIHGKSEET